MAYLDHIQTCHFVAASKIVPEQWSGWFWEAFSANAPFSWGDNDRTLITARRFAEHAEELEFPGEENDATLRREYTHWVGSVYELNYMYIDLEK